MNKLMFVFENCDCIMNRGFIKIKDIEFYGSGGKIKTIIILVRNLDKNSQARFLEGDLTQINFGVPESTLYISEEDKLIIETCECDSIKLKIDLT